MLPSCDKAKGTVIVPPAMLSVIVIVDCVNCITGGASESFKVIVCTVAEVPNASPPTGPERVTVISSSPSSIVSLVKLTTIVLLTVASSAAHVILLVVPSLS